MRFDLATLASAPGWQAAHDIFGLQQIPEGFRVQISGTANNLLSATFGNGLFLTVDVE